MCRSFKFVLCLTFITISVKVYPQEFLPLWQAGRMPNSKGIAVKEKIVNNRILQVETPGIYVFLAAKEENNGGAVLICPSGGYHHLTYDLGGFQLAKWFNTIGMNAFVLIYRLPTSPDLAEKHTAPLQDAQRAMKLIRANSERWNINPDIIGVVGASAGGHLASTLATFKDDISKTGDSTDKFDFKPEFQILVSPVITMKTYTHNGSRNNLLGEPPAQELVLRYSNELHADSLTPPCFLVHAQDDKAVNPQNSLLYFQALQEHDVKASLHIFPFGGHSIGLTRNPGSTQLWIPLCEAWLKEMGFNKTETEKK